MATSGITTYTRTVQQVVDAAYRKTGIMAKGQTADGTELTEGIEALNLVIAELRGEGLNLWKLINTTLTMVAGQAEYTLAQPNKLAKLYQAWLQDNSSQSKIPLNVVSIFNYNFFPLGNNGTPVQIVYEPKNSSGKITLWPAPNSTILSTKTLHLVGETELEVATDAAQTIDFPTEWYNTVIYYTALSLAVENNVPLQDRSKLAEEAKMHLEMAKATNNENASLFFQPVLSR